MCVCFQNPPLVTAFFDLICGDQPAAHFGALVFGSDIDGRQMRGKGSRAGTFSFFCFDEASG
jgi:hypothetical protein